MNWTAQDGTGEYSSVRGGLLRTHTDDNPGLSHLLHLARNRHNLVASLPAWTDRTAISAVGRDRPVELAGLRPGQPTLAAPARAARLGGPGGTGPHLPPRRPRMGITGRGGRHRHRHRDHRGDCRSRRRRSMRGRPRRSRTSHRPERAAPLGLSATPPRRDRAAPLSPSKRRCRTGSTSWLSRRPRRSLSDAVRPSSEQPQTITGVRPIRTPCRSARRSVATTRTNRAGPTAPPRHHQSSGRHTKEHQ